MSPSSFGHRHPRVTLAALALAILAVMLLALEGVATFFVDAGDAFKSSVPLDWTERDAAGIEWAKPGGSYRIAQRVRATGETVFDVTLSTDALGRRTVPGSGPSPREHFILFFGGSYVLGWGLEDAETLPAKVAERAPDWMPYNYGFHLHGPGEALARLDSGTLRGEVAEPDGIFLYLYTDSDHDRAIGSMRIVSAPYGALKPYYRFADDGGIEAAGSFEAGRPWRTWLYRWIGRSHLLQLARIDLRPGRPVEQVGLVAGMLAAARDRFSAQFPGSRFVVLIFPDSRRAGPLVEQLESLGVAVLDWAEPGGAVPQEWWVGRGDRHPNAIANAALADRLVEELGLGGASGAAGPRD